MGFDVRWVALIMECISTVNYFILINGEPSKVIQSYRKRTTSGGPTVSLLIPPLYRRSSQSFAVGGGSRTYPGRVHL